MAITTNIPEITDAVLEAVVSKMADPNNGFNAQLAATINAKARFTTNASWLLNRPLQFPDNYAGNSLNVLLAPLPIDDWLKTSPSPCPFSIMCQIYVISALNEQNTKGLVFDGIVNVGFDFHVLWGNQSVRYDMDAPVSAIESTIFTIFNTAYPLTYQNWPSGFLYNGILSVPARSSLVVGGSGYMQLTTMNLQVALQVK